MAFDWDPQKAKSNRRKHGISFETAMTVWTDGARWTEYDLDHSDEEERWVTIGQAQPDIGILHVTWTQRGDTVRIISARKATLDELRRYFEHDDAK